MLYLLFNRIFCEIVTTALNFKKPLFFLKMMDLENTPKVCKIGILTTLLL